MFSVVITEVMQFTILTVTSIIIGVIAIVKVSPEMMQSAGARGLDEPVLRLEPRPRLDGHLRQGERRDPRRTATSCSRIIFGLMFFKGVLASLAGPAPNYDMQRVLATRNPREACLMNGMVNVVLYFPRYMMIAGLTVAGLGVLHAGAAGHGQAGLREAAAARADARRAGRASSACCWPGSLAAFMSNFAATINAAPAYIVNDIYKRFINPNSPPKTDVLLSRIASVVVLLVGHLCSACSPRASPGS